MITTIENTFGEYARQTPIRKRKDRDVILDLIATKNFDKIVSKKKKKDILRKMNNLQEQGFNFGDFDLNLKPITSDFKDSILDMIRDVSKEIKSGLLNELMGTMDITSIGTFCLKISAIIVMCWAFTKGMIKLLKGIVRITTIFLWSDSDIKYATQGFEKAPVSTDTFVPLVSVLLGFLSTSKFDAKSLIDFSMKWNRINSFLGESFDGVKNLVIKAINLFRSYILDLPPMFDDGTGEVTIDSWMDSIRDYQILVAKKELRLDSSNYSAIQSLLVKGRLLQKIYQCRPKEYDSVKISIRIGITDIEKLMDEFNKSSFGKTKLRPKPFTLLLKGKSGVGKSAVTVPLLDAIMIRTIKNSEELARYEQNNMDFIYSRAAETGFWDGYCGQRAVVMDDFMQVSETKATGSLANEAFDMIRASNVFPHLLHKAHLDDKGNSFFEGRIILCSTNNFRMHSEVLIEPEALIRRFDIVAEVYPKREFCKPETLSGPKGLRRLDAKGNFSTDVYEFHVEQKDGSFVIMDYAQFVTLCVSVYNKTEEWGEDYLDRVSNLRSVEIHDKESILKQEDIFYEAQGMTIDREKHAIADAILENIDIHTDYTVPHETYYRIFTKMDNIVNFDAEDVDNMLLVRYIAHIVNLTMEYTDGELLADTLSSVQHIRSQIKYHYDAQGFQTVAMKKYILHSMWKRVCAASTLTGGCSGKEFAVAFNALDHFVNFTRADIDNSAVLQVIAGLILDFEDKGYRPQRVIPFCIKAVEEARLSGCSRAFEAIMQEKEDDLCDSRFDVMRSSNISDQMNYKPQSGSFFPTSHDDLKKQILMLQAQYEIESSLEEEIISRSSQLKSYAFSCFREIKIKIANFDISYPWIKWVVMVTGMLGTAIALFSTFSKRLPEHDEQYTTIQAGTTRAGKVRNARGPPKALRPMNMLYKSQGLPHAQTMEVLHKVTCNNTYIVTFAGKRLGQALAIKDSVFMMNAHFYDNIKEEYEFLQNSQEQIHFCPLPSWVQGDHVCCFNVPPSVFMECPPHGDLNKIDLWFVDFKALCRPHRDISNNFVTTNKLKQLTKRIPIVTYFTKDFGVQDVDVVADNCKIEEVRVNSRKYEGMTYTYPSQYGDCGTLTFLNEHSNFGNVIGMHAAGNGTNAVSTFVTREFLIDHLPSSSGENLSYVAQSFKPSEVFDEFDFYTYGSHRAVGKVDKGVHLTRKSKLRKSFLYDCFPEHPCTRSPAVLEIRDGVDPYDGAVARYATPDFTPDHAIVEECMFSYLEDIQELPYRRPKSILSFREACCGIEGEPYINAVNRKTSPGFPWVQKTTMPGKKSIFGIEDDYSLDTPLAIELRDRVEHVISMAREGKRCYHIYMDTLKDELRSYEKVEKLQTRMISCSPLDYTVAVKMYFGSFVDWYLKTRIHNGSAVGINPLSREWTNLANRVTSKGDNIIAGDFSGFDSTQNSYMLKIIVELINRWYNDGEENARIRRVLWMEIHHSKHLQDKVIVQWFHCLPSGNPLTVIINTIYVNIVFRCTWVDIFGIDKMDMFRVYVSLIGFGDDSIMGVSSTVLEYFNYISISESMKRFGMNYTTEDKKEATYLSKQLDECTFLKRGFSLDNGVYTAPLALATIYELPYWYRKGPGVFTRIRDNCENALKESTLYGRDFFEHLREILNETSEEKGEPLRLVQSFSHYKTKLISDWRDFSGDSDSENSDDEYKSALETIISELKVVDINPTNQDDSNLQEKAYVSQMGILTERNNLPAANNKDNTGSTTSGATGGSLGTTTQLTGQVQTDNTNTNEMTTFMNDANERVGQPFEVNNMNTVRELNIAGDVNREDVKQFLATPVRIRQYTITTAYPALTTLGLPITLPFDQNNLGWTAGPTDCNTGIGMWMSRLNSFMGFRATAVLTFQVNVNRFSQGRILINYIPGQNGSVSDTNTHRLTLKTRTQLPRTEINLNQDTSAVLRVPYVSANNFYNLQQFGTAPEDKRGIMGRVYTSVYSPLVGSTSLNMSVLLHFEDVELIIPTYAPQSGLSRKEALDGIISAPANHISTAMRSLQKIPTLSSLASAIGHVSRAVALTAANFGYSKPLTASNVERFINCGNGDMLNVDIPDPSNKLSMNRGQGIDLISGFAGNDIDEMSVEYICNRPCWLKTFTWSDANAHGSNLTRIRVGPNEFFDVDIVAAVNVESHTPFSMVASLAGFWRADFVFTFKLVKTEFHTGRLSITYKPGPDVTVLPPFNSSPYLSRAIVDIKESDTFSFRVPFTSESPMLTRQDFIGLLSVDVMTPLNAPATVSSSMQILVEVAAENVAFSGVSTQNFAVVTGDDAGWTPQSTPFEKVQDLGNMPTTDPTKGALVSCGESIHSIKQLMLRKCGLAYNIKTQVAARSINLRPFTLGGAYKTGSGAGNPVPTSLAGDRFALLSSCYVLSRGGARYTFTVPGAANDLLVSMAQNASLSPFGTNAAASSDFYGTGALVYHKPTVGTVNFEAPQWSTHYARENQVSFSDSLVPRALGEPEIDVSINCATNFNTGGLNSRLFRSCAEDTVLGFFIGIPTVWRLPQLQPWST